VLEADVEVDRRDFTVRAQFQAAPGERLALFGPSGAGKTTILETVAGLVAPCRGSVVLAGRILTQTWAPRHAVPPWRRRVGLLRQDPALFPHLSVRENLAYAPGADGRGEQARRIAGQLGIDGLLDDRPARLSGGQAHRVALGRLLLGQCDALLLDEPYAGLDTGLRRVLTDLVRELAASRGVPAVLVAHELAEAQAFADRLAVLDRGRILQVGSPSEVVRRPATRRVAELVGYLGFVPVSPADPAGPAVGVHPERVTAGAHPGLGMVLAGPVRAWRPAGAGWEADIETAGTVLACRLPDRPAADADGGELVVTLLDPPCFGPDGDLLPRQDQVRS
jgi:ABC-type sulfate/molybdate transport systems ATPase subunit